MAWQYYTQMGHGSAHPWIGFMSVCLGLKDMQLPLNQAIVIENDQSPSSTAVNTGMTIKIGTPVMI